VPARQRDRAYQACQRRRRVNLKFLLAFFLVRSRLARDRVIVACDKEIDRLNIRAPDTEYRRLRKVEAEARRIGLTQGSILQNCRLPNLLIGQHGSSQAWPLPQPNALACSFCPAFRKMVRRARKKTNFTNSCMMKWLATTPCADGPRRRRLHCRRYVLGQTPLTREYRGREGLGL
jgi:hypothetical protein